MLMQLSNLLEKLENSGLSIPVIKEGKKTKGVVLRKTDSGVLVSCEGGLYTAIILSKEVKDLERNGTDITPGAEVEAEILNTNLRHEEGYFIISVSKLLQYDIRKDIIAKADRDEIFTVVPTEANL
jgi:ribosomal protein S1